MIETIREIGAEMNSQDHRSTSHPLFVVVQDMKIYGVDTAYGGVHERQDPDYVDDDCYCESCAELLEKGEDLPDDCDDCMEGAFVTYRIEKDVPQLHHGVFFTAKACDEYIARRRYEFNGSNVSGDPHSYAISAYWSEEMKLVQEHLSKMGAENGVPHANYKAL